MFIFEWISVSTSSGALIPPYPTMRSWGDRLILCFPFLMFAGEQPYTKFFKLFIRFLMLVFAVLMIVTSARGVWLALACYLTSWAILANRGRQLVSLVACLCLVLSFSLLIPNNPLSHRFTKITYTSDRVNYTWGPAFKFWRDSPVYGIGYGSQAFRGKAAELEKNSDEWLKGFDNKDKENHIQLGPHSNYLETLAGGGLIGIVLLLYFYWHVIRNFFLHRDPRPLLLAATGTGIFVKYMIHGTVESINWKALGILFGLMLATLISNSPNTGKFRSLTTLKKI
ncbi:O-antigen ligase family protein [Azonexus sp. IMCC34839]|uniref:O-antigen ligase family protein n=1 Tax=Azonexus sp. IMCC34839 TaxID=3133695 RepID=UPI00399AD7D5